MRKAFCVMIGAVAAPGAAAAPAQYGGQLVDFGLQPFEGSAPRTPKM